jgi:hypothetical protein
MKEFNHGGRKIKEFPSSSWDFHKIYHKNAAWTLIL